MLFCGYLWSPILEHTTDILEELNKTYKVYQYFVYDFKENKEKHDEAVLKIYTTDDIAQEKIKNVKLKSMAAYPHKFVYFLFDIPDPKYRIKAGVNTKISTIVEAIKKQLREKYMTKVKNYIHDIIIHVSDNETQPAQIAEIMKSYQAFKIQEFMNLKTFLRYQYNGSLFTRVDMLVRKYSIEQYLKNNEYDFALYNKMQKCRGDNQPTKKFIQLIDSLREHGYKYEYPIEYEALYKLRNGSHRLAYLYSQKSTFICCSPLIKYFSHGTGFCHYSINWFKSEKFSAHELKIIEDELHTLDAFMK